jgi:hypothetical protein
MIGSTFTGRLGLELTGGLAGALEQSRLDSDQ